MLTSTANPGRSPARELFPSRVGRSPGLVEWNTHVGWTRFLPVLIGLCPNHRSRYPAELEPRTPHRRRPKASVSPAWAVRVGVVGRFAITIDVGMGVRGAPF